MIPMSNVYRTLTYHSGNFARTVRDRFGDTGDCSPPLDLSTSADDWSALGRRSKRLRERRSSTRNEPRSPQGSRAQGPAGQNRSAVGLRAGVDPAARRPCPRRGSGVRRPGPLTCPRGAPGVVRARSALPAEAAAATPRRAAGTGLARSIRLFRLFRLEQTEPDLFYSELAEDAADQLGRYAEFAGRTVVDVGGGAGLFTEAFRARGADCYLFEPDSSELLSRGDTPSGAVLADGFWLPVADASADVCFSSNVLEHVADPPGLIEEMIRATKPGGIIYLSFTNWYSPWGGHEMSPWHLLGAVTPPAATPGGTASRPSTRWAATCSGCISGRPSD